MKPSRTLFLQDYKRGRKATRCSLIHLALWCNYIPHFLPLGYYRALWEMKILEINKRYALFIDPIMHMICRVYQPHSNSPNNLFILYL